MAIDKILRCHESKFSCAIFSAVCMIVGTHHACLYGHDGALPFVYRSGLLKKAPRVDVEQVSPLEIAVDTEQSLFAHTILTGQSLLTTSTCFRVHDACSWANLDFTCDVARHKEYDVPCPNHGLAFCYSGEGSALEKKMPFLGLVFLGEGEQSGLSFTKIRANHAGAALYSDKDIVFDHLKGTLLFEKCESRQEGGGGVSGRSIHVHGCCDVTVSGGKTDVHLEDLTDFSRGGGGFYAHPDGSSYASQLSSGSVIFSENTGAISIKGNHAEHANGGFVACEHFSHTSNRGNAHFKENQACSGGAISAKQSVYICKNTGRVEFSKNKAQVASSDQWIGGGALFACEELLLLQNHGVSFKKNSSDHHGGACVSKSIKIEKNVKDTTFSLNRAALTGGALSSRACVEMISNKGDVVFEDNRAKDSGGAIFCYAKDKNKPTGSIKIAENTGETKFLSNESLCAGKVASSVGGGALYGERVLISSNTGDVIFSRNKTSHSGFQEGYYLGGGAILSNQYVDIVGNTGTIQFSYNGSGKHEKAEKKAEAISEDAVDLSVQGGGAILSKAVYLKENSQSISFSYNSVNIEECKQKTAILGGGALLGTDSVRIVGNDALDFTNNMVHEGEGSGGAILSKKVVVARNHQMHFSRNSSSFIGGAICSLQDALDVHNNTGDILFVSNNTKYAGGALASAEDSVALHENKGSIVFKNNLVWGVFDPSDANETKPQGRKSGGGAIFAGKDVSICANQKAISFDDNQAFNFGGAILAGSLNSLEGKEVLSQELPSRVVITNNESDVTFSGNFVSSQKKEGEHCGGGAIHTQDLVIKENLGSVLFYRNRAPRGGAVYIRDKGKVFLEARGGDILFYGNRNGEQASDGLYLSGKESRLTTIAACQGCTVHFADAITFEDLQMRTDTTSKSMKPTLLLNSESEGMKSSRTGVIRFSSARSRIPQVAALEAGTLALSEGAELWLCGLTQKKGSQILLEAGTTLRIFDPSAKPIVKAPEGNSTPLLSSQVGHVTESAQEALLDIHSIQVDISSFAKSGDSLRAPQIIVPSNHAMEGDIDLVLVDTLGVGYENHNLLNTGKEIALIAFKEMPSMAEELENAQHIEGVHVHVSVPAKEAYGYEGRWSNPQVVNGNLMISWTPTGYRLNPEKEGAIVLNTLFGEGSNLRSIKNQQLSHNMTEQRMNIDFSTNAWVAGLGTFSRCPTVAGRDGFRHRASGYACGLDTQFIEDCVVGGCFSQLVGHTESQTYTSRSDQNSYYGSAYIGFLFDPLFVKGSFVYGNTRNHLHTMYAASGLGQSHGAWNSQGYLADVHVDLRQSVHANRCISTLVTECIPFVEVEYMHLKLPGFSETGGEARLFSDMYWQNVSIPCGVTLENRYAKGTHSEVNSVTLTYILDLYRKQTDVHVTLPVAGHAWDVLGARVPKQALKARFTHNMEWNSYLSTFFGCSYEWRQKTQSYDGNGGLRVIF